MDIIGVSSTTVI